MTSTLFSLALVAIAANLVNAESHTVRFDNQCGFGTPTLLHGGTIVSTGQDFTSNSSFAGAIAYLQTGPCLFNGENCLLLEMTLNNPTCAGCGSSTDISLIPPHAFNVPAAFSYYGGCDDQGTSCNDAQCSTAFFKSDDNQVQVACQADNVNLLITFCGNGNATTDPANAAPISLSPTSKPQSNPAPASTPTSTHVLSSSSAMPPQSPDKATQPSTASPSSPVNVALSPAVAPPTSTPTSIGSSPADPPPALGIVAPSPASPVSSATATPRKCRSRPTSDKRSNNSAARSIAARQHKRALRTHRLTQY